MIKELTSNPIALWIILLSAVIILTAAIYYFYERWKWDREMREHKKNVKDDIRDWDEILKHKQ